MINKVAYLGPEGTFSEEAAKLFLSVTGIQGELSPYSTIIDCADAVEDGRAAYAVVPLENSIEGSVHDTLDVLTAMLDISILAEMVLEIEHNLLVRDGGIPDISRVYSHPQALAQCRNYLRKEVAQASLVPVLSTAEAAAMVAKEGKGAAAVASEGAATRYGLQILASGLQNTMNKTRFLVLGNRVEVLRQPEKTSLVFAVKNVAGSLFRVLQAFASHEVNLTRIESRPAKSQLGEYIFFVDLDGSPKETPVKAALREAAREAVMLKLLGAYPVFM